MKRIKKLLISLLCIILILATCITSTANEALNFNESSKTFVIRSKQFNCENNGISSFSFCTHTLICIVSPDTNKVTFTFRNVSDRFCIDSTHTLSYHLSGTVRTQNGMVYNAISRTRAVLPEAISFPVDEVVNGPTKGTFTYTLYDTTNGIQQVVGSGVHYY